MCHTRIPGVVENIISFNPSIFYTLFSLQGIEDSAKGKKKKKNYFFVSVHV